MLPLRASIASLDAQEDGIATSPALGRSPLGGGSAKSLGLVREDGEGTAATVARRSSAPPPPALEAPRRSSAPPPPPGLAAMMESDERVEDDDGAATVLKGEWKRLLPGELEAAVREGASSDDDDLNETRRKEDSDDELETPVGIQKRVRPPVDLAKSGTATALKTPVPMPADPPAEVAPSEPLPKPPESCQTRVAPIVAPTPAASMPVPAPMMTGPMPMPMPSRVASMAAMPQSAMATVAIKPRHPNPVLAKIYSVLPPHKLALVVSLTLMVAALTFVFVRSRQPAPQAVNNPDLFPPAPTAEVVPASILPTTPPPFEPGVLPPPAPTWQSPPPADRDRKLTEVREPKPAHHRATRATTRVAIPTHREQ